MSLWLVPWIVHLQMTLPEERFSIPWRAMWVWFDVVLLVLSLLVTYFLARKSFWASLALAALAALLAADTWFDFMTVAIAPDETATSMVDLAIELPLAFFSVGCAVYILQQAVSVRSGRG